MKISKTYKDGAWVSVTTGAFKGRIGTTADFRESDNSYRLQLVDGESPDVRWNPSEFTPATKSELARHVAKKEGIPLVEFPAAEHSDRAYTGIPIT